MSSMGLVNNNTVSTTSAEVSPYARAIEIIRFLLAYGWIIALAAGIGGGGAYVFANMQDHVYESYAKLIVLPFGTPTEGSEIEAIRALNLNVIGTYIQIMRSRELRNSTFDALEDQYSRAELREAEIIVAPISNSSVITITAQSKDPQLAQDLANAVAETTMNTNPVQALIDLYPISLLDPADAAIDIVSPGLLQTTLFGVIGGAMMGLILAYIMDVIARYRYSTQVVG